MNIESDRNRILQKKNLELLKKLKPNEMVTVYYFNRLPDHHMHRIDCVLIPNIKKKEILSGSSCDFPQFSGYPGFIDYGENGNTVTTYYRYASAEEIEPLVIDRSFHGVKPDYKEINEEFRLFHNLFYDKNKDKYIKIDESGDEEIIIVVEPDRIQIRLKEIKEFLEVKKMFLSIQFEYNEYSQYKLAQLNLSSADNKTAKEEDKCWTLTFEDFSCFRGKNLILPFSKSKNGMSGFAQEQPEQYVDFIIDVDDEGENIMYTCNPKMITQCIAAVHFKKSVLDKYYKQSSKFSVEDSYLRCGSLWGFKIDNHHKDKVCVWLSHLGLIPYKEQEYWKSYNIAPVGSISEVYFKRQILGEFTDTEQLDHIFKNNYDSLQDACCNHLGWQLLLPLSKEDLHHLSSIRIPATEEQSDFDDQILALTKILIDSLNEKKLTTFIPSEDRKNVNGSISRLEKVFQTLSVADYEKHIKFLRNLQDIRSSSVAHRKGSTYEKIAKTFGITSSSLITVIEQTLAKANEFLEFLIYAVNNNSFKSSENL